MSWFLSSIGNIRIPTFRSPLKRTTNERARATDEREERRARSRHAARHASEIPGAATDLAAQSRDVIQHDKREPSEDEDKAMEADRPAVNGNAAAQPHKRRKRSLPSSNARAASDKWATTGSTNAPRHITAQIPQSSAATSAARSAARSAPSPKATLRLKRGAPPSDAGAAFSAIERELQTIFRKKLLTMDDDRASKDALKRISRQVRAALKRRASIAERIAARAGIRHSP
ncbi:hypothetical protein ACM66B_006705 [Microbotryomycetes sp. NB124-2]